MNEYSDRIKCFYEFLHKKSGKIRLMIDNYLDTMGINIKLRHKGISIISSA